MQTIHHRAIFVMKVPFTMTLSLEVKFKKTKQYRIEYLTTQKIESDGPIRIFVIAKLRFMDVSFPRTFVPGNETAS